jgi:hypothetical protein
MALTHVRLEYESLMCIYFDYLTIEALVIIPRYE